MAKKVKSTVRTIYLPVAILDRVERLAGIRKISVNKANNEALALWIKEQEKKEADQKTA